MGALGMAWAWAVLVTVSMGVLKAATINFIPGMMHRKCNIITTIGSGAINSYPAMRSVGQNPHKDCRIN